MKRSRLYAFAGALLATSAIVLPTLAANIPFFTGPGGSNPANLPAAIPDLNTLVGNINSGGASGVNSNTLATYSNFRNFLDNGGMAIAQAGTTQFTGGTTSGCNVKTGAARMYAADRWCIDTNVSSGDGRGQIVTATPSPLQGFMNSLNVVRNSGSLTQTICAIQEIPTNDSIQLQGQQVTLSVFLQALTGLNADNGNAVTLNVITGTGTDEGLGSVTASPAITPAWTGIATPITGAKTITTSWARYSVTGSLASGAKEVGVEICFHPQAGSGGSTDGFAMVGAQLEQGATPSSFEFRPLGVDLTKAQQYFMQFSENAAGAVLAGGGYNTNTSTCVVALPFPTQMRSAPVYSNTLSASTFKEQNSHVTTATALTTPFSGVNVTNTLTAASLSFTMNGQATVAGDTCQIVSAAGTGTLQFSSDF